MYQQNTKSATTAGLLGIFLGAFGAHNWYLGEKSKGIAHICMMSGGVLVVLLASVILPNVMSARSFLSMAGLMGILSGIASLAMSASGIWGLVEGIIILSQGDAGLARKGYAVAMPQTVPNYYGQPGYGPQGYGQPYNNEQNGYNQPPNNWQNGNNYNQQPQNQGQNNMNQGQNNMGGGQNGQ